MIRVPRPRSWQPFALVASLLLLFTALPPQIQAGPVASAPVPQATPAAAQQPEIPAEIQSQLPANATIISAQQAALTGDTTRQWVVLYQTPPASGQDAPMLRNTYLAIYDQVPAGYMLAQSIGSAFALAPKLDIVTFGQRPAIVVSYTTGAHSGRLFVIQWDGIGGYSFIFDQFSNTPGIGVQNIGPGGTPVIVKQWSPYCRCFACSPSLVMVYEYRDGRFVNATGNYPDLVNQAISRFQDVLSRATDWEGKDTACLYASLGWLQQQLGNTAQATSDLQRAQQLAPGYDVKSVLPPTDR